MSDNFIQRLNELPGNLSNHLMITVIALGVGVLLSVPTAILLARLPRWRYPVLTAAGVIQTIPSLALLALMVPILDQTQWLHGQKAFGFWPAVIALTLYSILPVLRNTVTGIIGVDPAMTEAARGVGMTGWQSLYKVVIPLATPVIIAGIRTSTVWVVGIATLATPVGQRCLGNYIFAGLQTRNWLMVMFGVVSAAALAVLLDLLIGGLQKAAEQRKSTLGIISGTGLLIVVIGGLISPSIVRSVRATRLAEQLATTHPASTQPAERVKVIRIGAKTFTEQYILSSAITQLLQERGLQSNVVESLGSAVVFEALTNGEIHLYVDYTGTLWANYMKETQIAPPWEVLARVIGWLAREHRVRNLGSLGFENAYVLAMRREQADELGIQSIDDLGGHAPDMKIGGDYEFFSRPEWATLKETYGLRFAAQINYDSSLMYRTVAEGEVDVIAGFSSDGRFTVYDLLILDDPRHAIPPYDAVLLLNEQVADHEELIEALSVLVHGIDPDTMRQANYMVDRDEDKKTVQYAANWLLEQIDTAK